MKQRKNPRISLNKLGEYLGATPARRKQILVEQKKPRTFQVYWYQEASNAIRNALVSGIEVEGTLLERANTLREFGASDHEITRNNTNAEAIEAFVDMINDLSMDDYDFEIYKDTLKEFSFGGVAISIKPDMILKPAGQAKNHKTGSLKLHFSKNSTFSSDIGQSISSVIYHYMTQIQNIDNHSHKYTMLVDIFNKKIHYAKVHYKKTLKEIEAACEEIRLRWDSI